MVSITHNVECINSSEMIDKRLEILENVKEGKLTPKQADKELLFIHSVSVSDSYDFELQRLFDWLQDENREPAQTKFTAGMARNVAREFEYLLKNSR